jgi:hypothetical protein
MIDQQLREFARAVATQLDGFEFQTNDEIGHAVWLGHPDGRRLFVRRLWNDHDRIEVSGHYPHSDYYFQSGEHRRITVAIAREPAAIAKEITRRLLPGYVQVLAKVQAHLAKQAAGDTRRAELAARLARLIPGASVHDDGPPQHHHPLVHKRPGADRLRAHRATPRRHLGDLQGRQPAARHRRAAGGGAGQPRTHHQAVRLRRTPQEEPMITRELATPAGYPCGCRPHAP